MEFSSYSFVEKLEQEDPPVQWLRIRYSVEACPKQNGQEVSGSCLIRSASRYWGSQDPVEGKRFVLLREFQSLRFFYADGEALSEGDWQNEWELEKVSDDRGAFTDQVLELPFPSAVQIEGEKGKQKESFFFPIASSYLRAWNPMTKAFPGFPEWKPPKKEKLGKNELTKKLREWGTRKQ